MTRDHLPPPYAGYTMPDICNSVCTPLHTRDNSINPTYLMYVCRSAHVGLYRLGYVGLCRPVYVGLRRHEYVGLCRPSLCRSTLTRSISGPHFMPYLDPIRGSSPTLVPEAVAVLQPQMKGHGSFLQSKLLISLADIRYVGQDYMSEINPQPILVPERPMLYLYRHGPDRHNLTRL